MHRRGYPKVFCCGIVSDQLWYQSWTDNGLPVTGTGGKPASARKLIDQADSLVGASQQQHAVGTDQGLSLTN